MSFDRQKDYMYRKRNEFVRQFVKVRNECKRNGYPIAEEFSETTEYDRSEQITSHSPCRAEDGNGAVNFYNYAVSLCTPTQEDASPYFFRLKVKTAGLVRGNIIIDQSRALIRTDDFNLTASLLYGEHTSEALIRKFEELSARAPEPQPLPPDPLAQLLLKYTAMLK